MPNNFQALDRIYTPGGIPMMPVYGGINPFDSTRDAFNRLRISHPETLFDSKQIFDNQPLFWDDAETSGTGTSSSHSVAKAATTISVGATTAGTRVRQTKQRFNYQPGKSQLILMTGVLGAGADGITRRIGYFDANDGLFFQLSGDTLSVVRRSNVTGTPVDEVVNQVDWNLDNMDGTEPGYKTIDTSKAQIFAIDFEWLGVGSVRFGFVIDGVFTPVHQMKFANNIATVYMSKPNLPLRYEIDNDGNGAASDLIHICSTVISEGGSQKTGLLGAVSTAGTHVDASTADALFAIIGIRLKAANVAARIDLLNISILAETTTNYEWNLLLNPTVANSFTFSDVANYSIQKATGSSSNTVTGGTLLSAGYGQQRSDLNTNLENAKRLGAQIDGTVDEIVLCCRPLSANADIQAAISFREW